MMPHYDCRRNTNLKYMQYQEPNNLATKKGLSSRLPIESVNSLPMGIPKRTLPKKPTRTKQAAIHEVVDARDLRCAQEGDEGAHVGGGDHILGLKAVSWHVERPGVGAYAYDWMVIQHYGESRHHA
jgi:hypothetical protein